MHSYSDELMIKTGIYKITCIPNGKFYIGSAAFIRSMSKSKLGFLGRLYKHLNSLKNNRHPNPNLQNSYNKYGIENFVFEILEICPPEQCIEREQYYLDTLKPFYPIGFNVCKNALNNTKSPSKNRTCSRDTSNLNNNYKKYILQYDLEGNFIREWFGISAAAKQLNVERVNIYKCCRGIAKSAKGFV
jgi:group I intron endonuclease